MIEITRAVSVDEEIVGAMVRLVRELSSSASPPRLDQLQEIVDSPCTVLLIARDRAAGGRIVGTLTLAIFRIPTGVRAGIEDVFVEEVAAQALGRPKPRPRIANEWRANCGSNI